MQTISRSLPAGWWLCPECGAEAQLPAAETAGVVVSCPDCSAELAPMWEWDEAVAAR